jgi:hypothetical protein
MGEHSEARVSDSTRRWVARLEKEYPELEFEIDNEIVWMGNSNVHRAVGVAKFESWEALTAEWHGHFESRKEAFECALIILSAGARTANEFRGERLASAWLEVWDGEYYEVRNRAIYLNPFDREELKLWPSEKWRVHRTHRRLLPFSAVKGSIAQPEDHLPQLGYDGEFDVESDEPLEAGVDWCLNRWETQIGPPADGFRWSNDFSYKYVLQVPVGWRLETHPDAEYKFVSFSPIDHHPYLRVITAFRDSEDPSEPSDEPKSLSSIETRFEAAPEDADDWSLYEWKLVFSGAANDMLAQVQLFTLRNDKSEYDRWVHALDSVIRDSMYVEA